jgi:hypothetical protein
VDTATQAAWDYVKNQWDEAYEFGYEPAREKPYTAKRRDNGLTLEAPTVESLQSLVREDYGQSPVPRDM